MPPRDEDFYHIKNDVGHVGEYEYVTKHSCCDLGVFLLRCPLSFTFRCCDLAFLVVLSFGVFREDVQLFALRVQQNP